MEQDEGEENILDDPMRTIYATKSKRPPAKPTKPFPYIAKEHFDPQPDHARETMKRQHEFCRELIQQAQTNRNLERKIHSQRTLHLTKVQPEEPYSFLPEEDEKGKREIGVMAQEETTEDQEQVHV